MPDEILKSYSSTRIVKATKEHIDPIATDMRAMDALEVRCFRSTPKKALQEGLENSQLVFTATDLKQNPLAMFGCGGVSGQAGYIWLLANNDFKLIRRDFVKAAHDWVKALVTPFKFCGNLIHAENKESILWLKHCGAVFPRQLKVGDHLFYEFVIINNF
jgi:hypothetical protein